MNSIAVLRLLGLLTSVVGIIGYSLNFDGVESDIKVLKIMAIFYILISIEFVAHHVYVNVELYHMIIHYILSITALTIGLLALTSIRRYPHEFVPSRFKEIIIYGAMIWLLDRNINFREFSDASCLILTIFSLIIAILSTYMFYSIKKLRTFFIINGEFLMALNFVIYLIGISTFCLCILPLIVATAIVIYTSYRIIETAKPFIIR